MPYRSALTRSFALALLAAPGLFAQATHAQTTPATALTPTSPEDFSYAYWLNGWRKYPGDERPDTLCFETSHYGLAINPADLAHPQFGRLTGETDYRAAHAAGTSRVEKLPQAALHIDVHVNGKRYRATRSLAARSKNSRNLQHAWMWESGRYAQHFEFIDLVFENDAGERLTAAANLRATAWPASITFDTQISPSPTFVDAGAPGVTGAGWCINQRPLTLPHKETMEHERFTLELWVNVPKRLAERNRGGWIVNKNRNIWQDGFFGIGFSHTGTTAHMNIGGGRENHVTIDSHTMPRLGTWTHLAMTYDGQTLQYYVNGKFGGKKTIGTRRNLKRGPMVLGARADSKKNRARLLVDDLRVWNRALTPKEIKAHASSAPRVAGDGLTFEHNFGEAIDPGNQPAALSGAKIHMALQTDTDAWRSEKSIPGTWETGDSQSLTLACDIAGPSPHQATTQISVTTPDHREASVAFDTARNCYVAKAGPLKRSWPAGYTGIRNYDTFEIVVRNAADAPTRVPFMLNLTEPANITGLCPVLCDSNGVPTGIPVQISKNWHETSLGSYLRAYTMLPASPGETRYQMRVVYGFYGTVPAASHAQLSLIGYGGNGRWDQLAIGCWGETICFDMDMSLVDVAITDVRGLMLRAGATGKSWGWTDAGWGGDWMHVLGKNNRKLLFSGMKTAYLAHGPCLSDVRHAGFYGPQQEVHLGVQIQTLRTDDYARTFQNLDYTFHQTLPAADAYFMRQGGNHGWYTPRVAYGNRDGLIKEITPARGLKAGDTLADRLELTGPAPWWIAFPGAGPHSSKSATGSRALIIRSYDAAFGDTPAYAPSISLPVTKQLADGSVDVNLLLTPPKGLTRFSKDDRVAFDAQWITVPRVVDDYYGPNQALRKHLTEKPRSWKTVYREAAGNDLIVHVQGGKLLRNYPIDIAADQSTLKVDIQGGVGYVPMRITGLATGQGYTLYQVTGGEHVALDQAVHGNDFWQTDFDPTSSTYSLTFNLPLDGLETSTWILKQQ